MLVEFRDAIRLFDATQAEVLWFLKQNRATSFSENFRLSVSAGDTSGSLHSLFASYKSVLPWRFEEHLETLKRNAATPNLPSEIVLKLVQKKEMSADELAFFESWQRASGKVVAEMISRSELEVASGASIEAGTAEQQFVTSFKAFVFFLRSLQDAVYGCLLISTRSPTAAMPDMKKILDAAGEPKYDHQVAAKLCHVPGYFEWFKSFKALRNRIKDGTSFGKAGTPPDVGIVLSNMQADGALVTNINDIVLISDVVSWVHINCKVIKQIMS